MKSTRRIVTLIALTGCLGGVQAKNPIPLIKQFTFLPDLPDTVGLAGPFVGTHQGALIIAGGANFPDKPLVEGGAKVWQDQIYVLTANSTQWDTRFKLARPIAYGASASTRQGLILMGGSDEKRDYSTVTLVRWDPLKKELSQSALPDLPRAIDVCKAVAIDDTVYLMAGQSDAFPANNLKRFWTLDIAAAPTARKWTALPPCPGKPRANVNLAVQHWKGQPCIFAFAGVHITPKTSGGVHREFLTDAWRYHPVKKTWTALADLPAWPDPRPIPDKARFEKIPASATAGSAMATGADEIYLFGGTTGRYILLENGEQRPFVDRPLNPDRILSYNVKRNHWDQVGEMPLGVIVTRAVRWNGLVVIPSGELKPGIRTPRVQAIKLP